jgi:hypothetical protein
MGAVGVIQSPTYRGIRRDSPAPAVERSPAKTVPRVLLCNCSWTNVLSPLTQNEPAGGMELCVIRHAAWKEIFERIRGRGDEKLLLRGFDGGLVGEDTACSTMALT